MTIACLIGHRERYTEVLRGSSVITIRDCQRVGACTYRGQYIVNIFLYSSLLIKHIDIHGVYAVLLFLFIVYCAGRLPKRIRIRTRE